MQILLPSEELIREIHEFVIELTDDEPGDLHPDVITLALERPKHYIDYESCNFHTVCAVIIDTLANKHPFLDGNKRTALITTMMTYNLNGIKLDYSRADQDEFVDLMLWIVDPKNRPDISEIAEKLKDLINKYASKGALRALKKAEYNF